MITLEEFVHRGQAAQAAVDQEIEKITWPLIYVISGGQTGADQAGLHAARACGYRTGGMAPKDYRTDAGPMPELLKSFGLVESDHYAYGPRTWWNVHASTGTVWFGSTSSPGGVLTRGCCDQLTRPYLSNPETPDVLRCWIVDHQITTLNVAGNRERTNQGIGARVEAFLMQALRRYTPPHKEIPHGYANRV